MAGISKPLRVSVGVHQESALSSLLFVLVMDTASHTMLHVGDVFLTSNSKAYFKEHV